MYSILLYKKVWIARKRIFLSANSRPPYTKKNFYIDLVAHLRKKKKNMKTNLKRATNSNIQMKK